MNLLNVPANERVCLCGKAGNDLSGEPFLSRDLVRMQNAGWIRSQAGENGRVTLFLITSGGKKLPEKMVASWEKAQEQAKSLLGEEDVASLGETVMTLKSKASAQR